LGALGHHIPFDLCAEPKHRDHPLGLEIRCAVEPHVLLDGHELHTVLEEAVHQWENLPYTPPQARELADQHQVTRGDLFSEGVQPPPGSCLA